MMGLCRRVLECSKRKPKRNKDPTYAAREKNRAKGG
jgi:hypothetical protein